jgi:hypothetical protein
MYREYRDCRAAVAEEAAEDLSVDRASAMAVVTEVKAGLPDRPVSSADSRNARHR